MICCRKKTEKKTKREEWLIGENAVERSHTHKIIIVVKSSCVWVGNFRF